MAAQVLEANERGGFDLSAAPTTPCAICATPRTSEELLAPSCQHPRHGACKKCMAMALARPQGRAAIDRDDGSMGCVAAGCDGRIALRDLLSCVEDPKVQKQVLQRVKEIREARPQVVDATSAGGLDRRKQYLATCAFLLKPDISGRDRDTINAYLQRNGVPTDVIEAARATLDRKEDPRASTCFLEAAAPVVHVEVGGQAHAPAFADIDDQEELASALDAEAEELLVEASDLTTVMARADLSKKKATKRAAKLRVGRAADGVAQSLEERGWACLDGFCGTDLVQRVLREIGGLEPFYDPSEIWVGSSSTVGAQVVVPSVRGDKVLWMCGAHPQAQGDANSRTIREKGGVEPCDTDVKRKFALAKGGGVSKIDRSQVARFPSVRDLFKAMDAFVLKELCPRVERLNDCASRSDGMLAIYPGGGARFQAHVDNTTDDGRRLTVLCYFNEKWHEDHGGALRLHGATGPVDVLPKAGRLACFYSDLMKHEVRPTHRPRASVTLWYYSASERKEAVARAKESEATGDALKASDDERAAARVFAEKLCDPNLASDDVGELRKEAEELPEASRAILAGMAGVPDFSLALNRLESDDLAKLRGRFAKMGVE